MRPWIIATFGAFVAELRQTESVAALALRVLHSDGGTLWRSPRGQWSEFDLANKLGLSRRCA